MGGQELERCRLRRLDEHDRAAPVEQGGHAAQRGVLHALDVDLDEVGHHAEVVDPDDVDRLLLERHQLRVVAPHRVAEPLDGVVGVGGREGVVAEVAVARGVGVIAPGSSPTAAWTTLTCG